VAAISFRLAHDHKRLAQNSKVRLSSRPYLPADWPGGFNVVPQRSTWDFIVASERRMVIAVVDDDPLVREALDGLLSNWCAECGNERNLTPGGHYFCANRRCKDGFDVTPSGS